MILANSAIDQCFVDIIFKTGLGLETVFCTALTAAHKDCRSRIARNEHTLNNITRSIAMDSLNGFLHHAIGADLIE